MPIQRLPYHIETERFVARCYRPQDAAALQSVIADNIEHLRTEMQWIRFEPQTLDEKLDLVLLFRSKYDAGTDQVMGIFDKQDGRLVGGSGLHPPGNGEPAKHALEIGYWLAKDQEGKGTIQEVVKALALVAFRCRDIGKLIIRMTPHNLRSEAIPKALGFYREGLTRRSAYFGDDEPRDITYYSMLRSEFESCEWLAATLSSVRASDALERIVELAENLSETHSSPLKLGENNH